MVIETLVDCPCCAITRNGKTYDLEVSIEGIRTRVAKGQSIALYVDGWSTPWPLYLDDEERLRAVCPTAPTVCPLVVLEEQGDEPWMTQR